MIKINNKRKNNRTNKIKNKKKIFFLKKINRYEMFIF